MFLIHIDAYICDLFRHDRNGDRATDFIYKETYSNIDANGSIVFPFPFPPQHISSSLHFRAAHAQRKHYTENSLKQHDIGNRLKTFPVPLNYTIKYANFFFLATSTQGLCVILLGCLPNMHKSLYDSYKKKMYGVNEMNELEYSYLQHFFFASSYYY